MPRSRATVLFINVWEDGKWKARCQTCLSVVEADVQRKVSCCGVHSFLCPRGCLVKRKDNFNVHERTVCSIIQPHPEVTDDQGVDTGIQDVDDIRELEDLPPRPEIKSMSFNEWAIKSNLSRRKLKQLLRIFENEPIPSYGEHAKWKQELTKKGSF